MQNEYQTPMLQLKQCSENNENDNIPRLTIRYQSLQLSIKLVTKANDPKFWILDPASHLVYGKDVRHRHYNATDLTYISRPAFDTKV